MVKLSWPLMTSQTRCKKFLIFDYDIMISLSLSLFFSLSLSLSLSLFLSLFLFLSIYLYNILKIIEAFSMWRERYSLIYQSSKLCDFIFFSLSLTPTLSISLYISVFVSIYLSLSNPHIYLGLYRCWKKGVLWSTRLQRLWHYQTVRRG